MITLQKKFEISTSNGLEVSIHLRKLWFIRLVFCRPRSFCFAWKEKMNGCDVLVLLALWVFAVSVFKYYPFGGCKYNETN